MVLKDGFAADRACRVPASAGRSRKMAGQGPAISQS
jgi:hypothetical protein